MWLYDPETLTKVQSPNEKNKKTCKYSQTGVYFFGGLTGMSSQDKDLKATNDLHLLVPHY